MLLRLRHPAFVGGDDEQGHVDGLYPGQHVLDEPLMTGNVHERDLALGWQGRPDESEVDGQTASLLLVPAIGVPLGDDSEEGRLAVIHVAGGADDAHLADRAAATTGSSAGSTVRKSMTISPASPRASSARSGTGGR